MSKILLLSPDAVVHLREEFEVSFKADREEISRNSISLDKDVTSKSPAALYLKLYQAREYTNRAGVLYSKYMKMHLLAKKLLLQKTEERRMQLSKIFKDNADVLAKLRSSEEKNKYCEALLSQEQETLFVNAKMLAEEAAGYMQYFKLQFDFYREIKSDILTQLGIIRSMMALGELKVVLNDLNSFDKDVDVTGKEPLNSEQIIGEGIVNI